MLHRRSGRCKSWTVISDPARAAQGRRYRGEGALVLLLISRLVFKIEGISH